MMMMMMIMIMVMMRCDVLSPIGACRR
jgi:hypothetical protein